MILADSSVWIDHLRHGDGKLAGLLNFGRVLAHSSIVGELALGSLRQRAIVLGALDDLPSGVVADDAEVRGLVEQQALFGRGIGWVDAHLLASVRLTGDARLWTRDKRLDQVAAALGIAYIPG